MEAAGITEASWPRLSAKELADIAAFLETSSQN